MHALFDERRYLIPFRSNLLPQIFTDTLVIGAGVAGARAAIAAAEHGDVIVISKGDIELSNTAWAQGGMAAVLTENDSFDSHVEDTVTSGAGLCDMRAVRHIISHMPERVRELADWGMRFDREAGGEFALGLEGAHSHHRILHADGDATGRELVRCLHEQMRQSDQIRVFPACFAVDLVTPRSNGSDPVMGAITYHERYGLQMIWAKATILASGGVGQIFRESSNPTVSTADGLAMAYRAGASLADLAMLQFHPTTLYVAGASRSLISEAVRGEGAHLVDRHGFRFMVDEHPLAELAPRDIVSRAIIHQLGRTGDSHVFLDVGSIGRDRFVQRFPGISAVLEQYEIQPGVDPIPVQPAAHFMIGGLWVDENGRTDVPGLYACGESACTGLHGANRLASNSLSESLVCGEIAGRTAEEMKQGSNAWGAPTRNAPVSIISEIVLREHGELDLADVRQSLRSVMWRNVGIERYGSKLSDVMDMCDFWARYMLDEIFDEPAGWETQNMLLAGAMITRSAHWRCESRGVHARVDYPDRSDDFRVHDLWKADSNEVRTVPCSD